MILDKLNVSYKDIVHKKHGASEEVSYGYLIDTILENKGLGKTASHFVMGVQTFNRMMRKAFPEVKLKGGNQTWCYYLLSLIEHKNCGKCDKVLPFTAFHKDVGANTANISAICKVCKSVKQEGAYSKYIDSHKKSYEKIMARLEIDKISTKAKELYEYHLGLKRV
jgi:predicted helicase